LPDDGTGQRAAGFEFMTNRGSADSTFFLTSRYDWAIWVGTQSDLTTPNLTQNINRQMNLHFGFNLNKIYRYVLNYADPAGAMATYTMTLRWSRG
jgi:hypothetical protein